VPEGPEDRCFSDLVFGRQLRHGLAVGVARGDLALLAGVKCVRFRKNAASTSAGRRCPNSHTASENSIPLSQFEQTGPDRPFNLSGISREHDAGAMDPVERWLILMAAVGLIGFLVTVAWMLAS
jgi:hypothetical protein